mgnify:CR=1 FL=1
MNDLSKLYLTQIEEEKQQILKRGKYESKNSYNC